MEQGKVEKGREPLVAKGSSSRIGLEGGSLEGAGDAPPLAAKDGGRRRLLPPAPILKVVLLLVSLLLVPAAAQARRPVPDGGRIDLGPGWRLDPLRGSSSFGGMARSSWHIDSRYFLGIELGFWGGALDADRLGLMEPTVADIKLWVGDLRFALGAHLAQVGPVWIYGVGGFGYHIVGVSVDDRYHEGATTGLFLGAGAYLPVGDRVGILIEVRFTLFARISTAVGRETAMVDAGGNLLWAGLVIFFEPAPRPGGFGL